MSSKKELTELDKWIISFMAALLYILISSPFMYRLTGALFSKLGLVIEENGCPNFIGVGIHSVVFAVLVRLLMLIRFNSS